MKRKIAIYFYGVKGHGTFWLKDEKIITSYKKQKQLDAITAHFYTKDKINELIKNT